MANFVEVLKELQQERSRLDEAIRVIGQLVSGNHTAAWRAKAFPTKRTLSQAARKKIAAAQRARWAKAKAQKKAA